MKFYISDTHFRHQNVLRLDGRPWEDVRQMEEDMIARWNKRVRKYDSVYILGDFCWGTKDAWLEILPRLKGNKFLIKGNHDLKQIPGEVKHFFRWVGEYKETEDNGLRVCMSHYPIICYRHDNDKNTVMLYGHVHQTHEAEMLKSAVDAMKAASGEYTYKGRLYNAFCGLYDWTPATIGEILERGGLDV